MRVTAKIEGLSSLLKGVKSYPEKVKQMISAELLDSAQSMANGAASDAPTDQGLLKNEITVNTIDDLNYEVVSQADYSPYVEFGTRSKVNIPAGLEEVAAQFKGGTGGTKEDAKEAIYAWCKRKGIPEDAWFSIYRSIMVKGVTPHPFFFKQIAKEKPNLIKNIKRALK